jgi:hypothetical protein
VNAEAAYWAAEAAAGETHLQLAGTVDPRQRAKLLECLAELTAAMARRHAAAFGPDPVNGIDMADSLAYSADLYRLLRRVEHAVSVGRGRYADGSDLDRAAASVLDEMTATPDLVDRMRLLKRLYEVVLPLVGGQAAETVACVPAPGMRGWEEQ